MLGLIDLGLSTPQTEIYFAEVKFWKADGSPASTASHKAPNFGQCWSPRGDQLAVFSYPHTIRLFGPAGTIEKSLETRTVYEPLAGSLDGTEIAGGGMGDDFRRSLRLRLDVHRSPASMQTRTVISPVFLGAGSPNGAEVDFSHDYS